MTISLGNLMMRQDGMHANLPAEQFVYDKWSIKICSIKLYVEIRIMNVFY